MPTSELANDDVLTGPQGFAWVVESVTDTVAVRRLATRENTRTLSPGEIGDGRPWRPR